MNKHTSSDEPTKKDVAEFVESQLYDIEAFGYAHKDSLVEGIMELLKRQHDYATKEAYIKTNYILKADQQSLELEAKIEALSDFATDYFAKSRQNNYDEENYRRVQYEINILKTELESLNLEGGNND